MHSSSEPFKIFWWSSGWICTVNIHPLFSVLRLTLRKTWIWLADQVRSRLGVCLFVCAFLLTLESLLLESYRCFFVPHLCVLTASNSSVSLEQMWAMFPSSLHLCRIINIIADSLCQRAVLTRDATWLLQKTVKLRLMGVGRTFAEQLHADKYGRLSCSYTAAV